MQIDDYGQAIALRNKLEAALPFRIQPGKQLLKVVEDKSTTAATWLDVDRVMYAGDEGGIMVNLLPAGDHAEQAYVTSLTHVVFDPEHELAEEVKAYQQQRTRQLTLQNQGGFAAELLMQQQRKKRKSKRKGFER